MAANEIHVDDVGTEFRVLVKDGSTTLDLSTSSTLDYKFLKPSGTQITRTGSFLNDGTDGYIKYITVSGDIDEIGTWKFQVFIEIDGGSWHSDMHSFKVHRNIT